MFKRLTAKEILHLTLVITFVSSAAFAARPVPRPKKSQVTHGAVVSDAVIIEWNRNAVTIIGAQPPFPAARFMLISQLAVFEAVNAISGKYQPYLGTIVAPSGASKEAAAISAAYGVLNAYLPSAALDQLRDDSLANIPDGQAKTGGIAVGQAVAAAMVLNRTNDGSAPALFFTPTSAAPGEWQLYGGCPVGGGIFYHWQNVRPFGISSASQFRADPPPSLDSGRYAIDFNEVQSVGDVNSLIRPADRSDVARFYAAAPPHFAWNDAFRQMASSRSDDIVDTARTSALMNMAIVDAHVSTFETKYHYRLWRPITAIPRADEDSNNKTAAGAFVPYIATPCFPSYPSAHGAAAGAAEDVLERAYGRFGHAIVATHPGAPGVVLNYSDLRMINRDIDDARVFGGIHFRFDQVAGERQGKFVAGYLRENVLRKVD